MSSINPIKFLVLGIFMFLSSCQIYGDAFDKFYDSPFGITGQNKDLIEFAKTQKIIPKISRTGKTLMTFNKMGFDILTQTYTDWLIEDFYDFCKNNHPMVLDLGSRFGHTVREALRFGAQVIYNDVEIKQLILGYQFIPPEHLARVYLNHQALPDKINIPEEQLDGIMAHRSLHFLTPQQVEASIQKFSKWLKPGGKLYIVTLAPQHKAYCDEYLPIYEANWASGNPWPGYPFYVRKYLPNQAYNLPRIMNIMDGRPLEAVLKKYGFKIQRSGFVSLKDFGVEQNRDGKESFGLIAEK